MKSLAFALLFAAASAFAGPAPVSVAPARISIPPPMLRTVYMAPVQPQVYKPPAPVYTPPPVTSVAPPARITTPLPPVSAAPKAVSSFSGSTVAAPHAEQPITASPWFWLWMTQQNSANAAAASARPPTRDDERRACDEIRKHYPSTLPKHPECRQ